MQYYGVTAEADPTVVRNIIVEHNSRYVAINWSLRKWMVQPALARYFFLPEYRSRVLSLTREMAEELVATGPKLRTFAPLPSEAEIADLSLRDTTDSEGSR